MNGVNTQYFILTLYCTLLWPEIRGKQAACELSLQLGSHAAGLLQVCCGFQAKYPQQCNQLPSFTAEKSCSVLVVMLRLFRAAAYSIRWRSSVWKSFTAMNEFCNKIHIYFHACVFPAASPGLSISGAKSRCPLASVGDPQGFAVEICCLYKRP